MKFVIKIIIKEFREENPDASFLIVQEMERVIEAENEEEAVEKMFDLAKRIANYEN